MARFHPRYSLRSLLLFSLLCGAGIWLWRDWAPWKQTLNITESGHIVGFPFVGADGHLHLLVEPPAPAVTRVPLHVVRDLSTGQAISIAPRAPPGTGDAELWRVDTKRDAQTVYVHSFDVDREYLHALADVLKVPLDDVTCLPPAAIENIPGQFVCVGSHTLVRFRHDPLYITSGLAIPLSPTFHVWRQVRPARWYGVAYLPQFWLAIILTAGLVLSLHRDARYAPPRHKVVE